MIDPAYLEKIGVYVDEKTGEYMRLKTRSEWEYDPNDPRAVATGNVVARTDTLVPYPVVLPLATDARSIEEARVRASQSGADMYHPTWGWLNRGRKPEKDHPENLGADTAQYQQRRVLIEKPSPAMPERPAAPAVGALPGAPPAEAAGAPTPAPKKGA